MRVKLWFILSFLVLFSVDIQSQKRVDIPPDNYDATEIVEISLKAGEAQLFIVPSSAKQTLSVGVDTEDPDGVAFIKLLNGDTKTDKWFDDFDDFEVLTGRQDDYLIEVKNVGKKTYETALFFSLYEAESYRNISRKDFLPVKNIRRIDFKNFLYPPVMGDIYRKVRVINGEFSEENEIHKSWFKVGDVAFGDIDGDKTEEAIVSLFDWSGGSGIFSDVFVFKLKNGKPVRIDRFGVGDRAFGGVRGVKIKNGLVIIQRNDAGLRGGACCSQFITTEKFRWDGETFVQSGKIIRQNIYPTTRIIFAKGASGKDFTVIFSPKEDTERFIVRAKKGQILSVTSNESEPGIYLLDGEAEVAKMPNGFNAKLEKDGDFVFHVSNYKNKLAKYSVKIEIK